MEDYIPRFSYNACVFKRTQLPCTNPVCFGLSPGMTMRNTGVAEGKHANSIRLGITPFAGINYVINRNFAVLTKLSLLTYGYRRDVADSINLLNGLGTTRFSYNPEIEVTGSYKKPFTKRFAAKASAGIAGSLFSRYQSKVIGFENQFPKGYGISRINNLYAVAKAGGQWKTGGTYHFLYLGADYHFGLRNEYQTILYDGTQPFPSSIQKHRGSYFSIDITILIGKEKDPWKKPLSARDKRIHGKDFVL